MKQNLINILISIICKLSGFSYKWRVYTSDGDGAALEVFSTKELIKEILKKQSCFIEIRLEMFHRE